VIGPAYPQSEGYAVEQPRAMNGSDRAKRGGAATPNDIPHVLEVPRLGSSNRPAFPQLVTQLFLIRTFNES